MSIDELSTRERLNDLDQPLAQMLEEHYSNPAGVRAAIFARCWPDDLPRRSAVNLFLNSGETLDQARERHGILWHPQWLIDAGYVACDTNGVVLGEIDRRCTGSGQISWSPEVKLPRVDDGAPANPVQAEASARQRSQRQLTTFEATEKRTIAGEVAVAALWMTDANASGIHASAIDATLSTQSQAGANRRGALWNHGLAYYLELSLLGWRVDMQVSIRDIFGLHLRSSVVQRAADVVVVSPAGKVMALVSSKFSWRSDRGTEAAQMVFLQRYRPDLPYVLVTVEFPRALKQITSESIEDQAYHLCRDWVGAWEATQSLSHPDDSFTSLDHLREAGRLAVPQAVLPSLENLVGALKTSATYL